MKWRVGSVDANIQPHPARWHFDPLGLSQKSQLNTWQSTGKDSNQKLEVLLIKVAIIKTPFFNLAGGRGETGVTLLDPKNIKLAEMRRPQRSRNNQISHEDTNGGPGG